MWSRVADLFHVTTRTLRRWRGGEPPARLVGRPVRRSPRQARNAVIHFLDEHGPHVGVPTLRACFPAMSRAELTDLLVRYRRVWRARHRVPLRVLTWPVAGRVWAIDFTGPVTPIEGRDRYLLAVRDLASGRQLLWLPVEGATGAVARAALATLFAEHGAPLVLKCDNGSPFVGAVVAELLAEYGVAALVSPPYWPAYNGAVEAGIGWLKDRTDAHAARAGHAGYWTWEDVAGARSEANALARPRGPLGPSPDELWAVRTAITPGERGAFAAAVEAFRKAEQTAAGTCAGGPVAVNSDRVVARCAIRLALEERGYLQYRRRTIPPPINRHQGDNIT
jgi:transposase InsO family protein